MEYRPLDITVISAENLKDVNLISKMDVYVVVSIAGDTGIKRKTPVHKDGGKSPKWNHRIKFTVDETAVARQPNLPLVFKLKSERPFGDRDIGEVSVPIKDLLDNNTAAADSYGGSERVVDYHVRTASGKPKGTLKFSYKFGEKSTAKVEATTPKSTNADEPVTAYPAHAGPSTAYPPAAAGVGYAPPPPGMGAPYAGYPPQTGYGYQPPPPGYGGGYPPAAAYGYPPQGQGHGYPPQGQGYGYPPQGQGYGYPPAVQQPKKKNGSKLGLGLGAGLLGGLLVGDMISDAGDMGSYDSGYDAGFDDAGFDF